jgi:hypothetical protein
LKKLTPPTAGSSTRTTSPALTATSGGSVSLISSGVGFGWRTKCVPVFHGCDASGIVTSVRPARKIASLPSMVML